MSNEVTERCSRRENAPNPSLVATEKDQGALALVGWSVCSQGQGCRQEIPRPKECLSLNQDTESSQDTDLCNPERGKKGKDKL